jgi:hypothetical protein
MKLLRKKVFRDTTHSRRGQFSYDGGEFGKAKSWKVNVCNC